MTDDLTPNSATPGDEPLVRLRNLVFSRGRRRIFDGVDLEVPRGKITAVMGPSGAGKTTVLRMVGGQLRPDAGEVWMAGERVDQLGRKALFALRQRMGMLFQSGALLTDLNVFENVAYPVREHTDLPEALIRKLVLLKLEAVGLRGARELMPDELSGGMARRVALARAIALDPLLIMYDEPFTGQDPISMGVLLHLIRTLNETLGITSLIVSHDITEVCRIAHHVCILADGKIIGAGAPEALQASDDPMVRQFMSGAADGPVSFHYPAPELLQDLAQPGAGNGTDLR